MDAGCLARLEDVDSTCEQCNSCGLLWCSVSRRCYCGGDGSCGGELLADTHAEQIQRNKEIDEWCPDAWSTCAESMLGCQSRNDDCGACLDRSACSWCVYRDAVAATASMCIFNGAIGGQVRRCQTKTMRNKSFKTMRPAEIEALSLDDELGEPTKAIVEKALGPEPEDSLSFNEI